MTLIRYELMPFGDAAEQAARLSAPAHLTITCSPRHGLDATVALAETLAGQGHVVAPHLAARRVRSRTHLREALSRLDAAGITDAVVIGGDGEHADGPFDNALHLLRAISESPRPLRATVGAYPEGHPLIPPEMLLRTLRAKQRYATSMTTQMCFSGQALVDWLRLSRAEGITLPATIGVPGRVDRQQLLAISLRIGVGASKRLLRKQPRTIARLLTRGAPEDAVRHLALSHAQDRELGIEGLHVFTFNRLHGSMAALSADAPTAARRTMQ